MEDQSQYLRRFAERLQLFLPLTAHAKPALSKAIRELFPVASTAPWFLVTSVFYAGGEHGIMCQLEAPDAKPPSPTLVAPIAHVGFDPRHPISHEITAYRKRRLETLRGADISSTATPAIRQRRTAKRGDRRRGRN